jgi:hypothetical protein
MYNTKTAVISNTDSSYMPAGINENVYLKEVNVRKSPTDRDFLEIIFENEQGQTATMTEWKNEKNTWIKTDEELQHRDDLQFGRILQLINCFNLVVEEEFDTFAEMINWVKKTLDPMITTKKQLRLKVSYDKNNYTKVSTYGIYVEPMDIAKTQIKKYARDNFERQVIADVEITSDPLATSTSSIPESGESQANDLPF